MPAGLEKLRAWRRARRRQLQTRRRAERRLRRQDGCRGEGRPGNAMKGLFVHSAGQEDADPRNAGFDPLGSSARASIFGAAEILGERSSRC